MALRIIVIGGGISGLSLGYLLSQKKEYDVIVSEAQKRAGGKIWTEREAGFIIEGGVNAFLDNRALTLELIKRLALSPLRSSDSARKRFIYSGGRLHRLPESPPTFLASPLISPLGKIRLFMEVFIPKGKADDETLSEFAIRRLGREAYEKLIDPMASGIYAGNPEEMSLKSCFPRIDELEKKYGSLIKALISLKRQSKRPVGATPSGVLTSFSGGMNDVVEALSTSLGERLRSSERAVSVERLSSGYVVHFKDSTKVEADAVVLAVPSYEAEGILRELDRNLSSLLGEIRYPPVSVVALAYRKDRLPSETLRELNAFGFLVPSREKRKILGVLYDSSIFPNRAPEGYVLLRAMIGGARQPETALLDERKLIEIVEGEIKDIVGIRAEPEFSKVFRHERAIPQYEVGHSRRLSQIEERLSRYRGLYITGNALRGVGFNDCIENSFKLAKKIEEEL